MAPATINVLLSTYPGLTRSTNSKEKEKTSAKCETWCIKVPSSVTISEVWQAIIHELPPAVRDSIIISTHRGTELRPGFDSSFRSLFRNPEGDFFQLRLSLPLCGGKGGFGSQLRAAGGKMSSRKRRQQGEQNGSSRNLDGRRLRTVTEAKALAEYLAIKPEMDKREKEERRKRWQAIVDMAEKKTEEIRDGGKTRLDSKYFETLEETTEKSRMAVLAALEKGQIKDVLGAEAVAKAESDESAEASADTDESEIDEVPAIGPSDTKKTTAAPSAKKFFGWDDDDDMSEDEEEVEEKEKPKLLDKGKSKAKA